MSAELASAPASAPEPETAVTGSGQALHGGKTKDLVVKLHGQDRNLGSFPAKLHTDLRHVVEMLRRRKRPRFSGERLSLLEEAIASSPYRSLEELRQQIEAWREEDRAGFDANRYYDSDRTVGYTEHNRGSQDTLTRRSLQLSSVPTEGPAQDTILAVDLGCGSGLSTLSALNAANGLGVIGLDLSSEMLRAEEWKEANPRRPLAGERLRADLAQPLPFRDHIFDLCYSVSAVHYLASDSLTQSAARRIGQLTSSVKRILRPKGRPCTLQAYMTRESNAVETFRQVALRDGWDICELVVDQSHGKAERDFLYLSHGLTPSASRPPRCALYRHCSATCALALETWAKGPETWPVRLDGAHRAWLVREHDRYARRILRLQKRCDDGGPLDHSSPGAEEQILADRLRKASECADEEARLSMILNVLHS